MYIEWVLVAHNTQWGMIFFIISWMKDATLLSSLGQACHTWDFLCAYSTTHLERCFEPLLRSGLLPVHKKYPSVCDEHLIKTCRYFLILSSSSAPRLRSSPPGRLTGQLAWQLLCYEISPISIKASASQTWGKEEDAIKTRLDVNLPSLLLNFNHPSHNHITYLAIVPRTTQVTMRWSFWMRHNKRNAPGFYRGDRYQFVNSFNNSS